MAIYRVGGGSGGGGGSSDSFVTFQVPNGTDPVATSPTDVLTFTSSDNSVTITGDSTTDTIDFVAAGGGGGVAWGAITGTLSAQTDLQAALDAKVNTSLASGNILVGSAGGVATSVTMSSEATIIASGALTLSNSAVIGKVLTGYSAATGVIAATDTLLQGFNKAVASNTGTTVTNRLATWSGTGGHLIQDNVTIVASANSITSTGAGAFNISSASDLSLFQGGSGVDTIRITSGQILLGRNDVTTTINLGATAAAAGASTQVDMTTLYNSSGAPRNLSIFGGLSSPTTSTGGASVSVRGGHTRATTLVGALPGNFSTAGGDHQNTGVAGPGGSNTMSGGNSLGSGPGGNSIVQGGTSGSGAAGVVQIGRTSTTNKNILNNALGTPNADALTMLNGPTGTAGDPDRYLLITINGTDGYIPVWNA